jgi:ABC-type multidrug transport system fused ATPase/permease subunit
VFLSRAGKLKSGAAGWGLTQALSITGLLTWAVRTLTDAETQFLSVERLSELINVESNGTELNEVKSNSLVSLSHDNEVALINSGWPVGRIQFNDVSMRYTPASSLVLKKVSVNVPSGTTLGVVGRTGSGKSSLLLTLFRLVEIEEVGSITIDGVDIRSLSLQGLRGSLSIIPQSATLFAGTLLYNLDSSGKTSTEDAWRALEASSSELARQFRDLEGLDTIITEGGMNLSQGQRQLICLARALVKRSNILVLDEATSSVDPRTDAQVQDTILREFVQKGVTVITVAHRLDTVLGYDKILVLDAGKVAEYGSPGELLKTDGYLRRLYDADQLNRLQGTRQKLTTILK